MKKITVRYASASSTIFTTPDDNADALRRGFLAGSDHLVLPLGPDGWAYLNRRHIEQVTCDDAPPEAK